MNYEEFMMKVAEMRFYQKEMARYRLKKDRQKASRLEKEVDDVIKSEIGDKSFSPVVEHRELPSLF